MKPYCLGVDVGGTTVKIGLFETGGTLVEKWEIPTDKSNGGEKVLSDIADSISEKTKARGIGPEDLEGAGIGVPGPVRPDETVPFCVNLGWGEKDVKAEFAKLTGLRVAVGNDANVAALGEMWQGGAKGYNNVLMVTLGTGVGGGLILHGHIVTGAHGAGAEIGHLTIDPFETELCNCGRPGCLEYYASATGAVRLLKRRLAKDDAPSSLRALKEPTAKDIFDAAKAGDALALAVEDEYCDKLALGISMISTVFDPAVVVLGGGVSKAGQRLADMVQEKFVGHAFGACKETKFVLATLGNDAGMYGSARMLLGD